MILCRPAIIVVFSIEIGEKMKALVCELCGSNEFVKEDGYFVCQHCHTKYSPEEAKKIMVEGTVDVSGSTVKVDSSDELSNALELARRARKENDSENARKYYEMIAISDPDNWESYFYAKYYKAMDTTIGSISSSAIVLSHCFDKSFELIKKIPENEQREASYTIYNSVLNLWTMYAQSINAQRSSYTDFSAWENFLREKMQGPNKMLITLGDVFLKYFNNTDEALFLYKTAINEKEPRNSGLSKTEQEALITKIRRIDSGFVLNTDKDKTVETLKLIGCYVATAVYGSYDCPEVWTLRRFRDDTLAETWYGRAFIRTYYAISPTIVKWFGKTEWFKNLWKPMLDRMVRDLQSKGVENTPYEDRKW